MPGKSRRRDLLCRLTGLGDRQIKNILRDYGGCLRANLEGVAEAGIVFCEAEPLRVIDAIAEDLEILELEAMSDGVARSVMIDDFADLIDDGSSSLAHCLCSLIGPPKTGSDENGK